MSGTKKPKGISEAELEEHLPPLNLVFTVIACSGFLFMFSFRDVFATGRVIGGSMDEAMLVSRELDARSHPSYPQKAAHRTVFLFRDSRNH